MRKIICLIKGHRFLMQFAQVCKQRATDKCARCNRDRATIIA